MKKLKQVSLPIENYKFEAKLEKKNFDFVFSKPKRITGTRNLEYCKYRYCVS
jgi:hypothetical protein